MLVATNRHQGWLFICKRRRGSSLPLSLLLIVIYPMQDGCRQATNITCLQPEGLTWR